ncbi:hypothetical protein SCUCBS95973_005958 [Sporothrix curviconia]|uniref:Major facilitator superfamily (MFS) profile domain-containing protein n=1 Tax=Sporothrix curviconia TaxID=1260050 RepID=A0ABP0C351_9PEZI
MFSKKGRQPLPSADGHAPPPPATDAPQNPIQRVNTSTADKLPTGFKLFSIMGALFLALFCVSLDRTVIATAIPKITNEFNSIEDIGWYGSAYLLTSASFQLFFGRLYAEFSIKWIFLAALVIFEVGSIVCATAPNSPALIVGRALGGLGAAGIASGALTIIGRCLPLHRRPQFTGAMGAAMGISQVIGPTIGGALADHASWRWCFWINLPIGGIAIPVVALLLNVPPAPAAPDGGSGGAAAAAGPPPKQPMTFSAIVQRFDLVGTVLIIPSIVSLLLALQWAGTTYAWNSWRIILLFVIFGVCLLAWGGVQLHAGDAATLPLRIVKNRSLASAMLYMFCTMGLLYPLMYYIPVWFQAVRNVSAQQSGVDVLAMTVPTAVFAFTAGFLTTAMGYYNPLMLANTVLASVSTGLITRFGTSTSQGYWIGSLVVFGIGVGLGGQQALMVPQTVLQGRDIALGTSAMIFMQTISGAIFLSVAQNLFASHLVSELERRAPGVDAEFVVDSGASDLQATMGKVYSPTQVGEIIASYAAALQKVFLMCLVLATLTVLGSASLEWVSVKKKKQPGAGAAAAEPGSQDEEAAVPPVDAAPSTAGAEATKEHPADDDTELNDLTATPHTSVMDEEATVALESGAGAAMPSDKE